MKDGPQVSIIMAVHNGAATVTKCLNSVAQQTYSRWEIICINDASTDNSATILEQWRSAHPNVSLDIRTHQNNMGLTKSLNEGIKISRGSLIARLDDDDWWMADKLSKQVEYLSSHPHCGIVGCWYINQRGPRAFPVRLPVSPARIKHDIFRRNPFGHSCVVIRRQLLIKHGLYNESLQYGQDRELWFRLLPNTQLANIPEFLCHRSVGQPRNYLKQRQQIQQQILTTHQYIQKYHAPWHNYLYLLVPILIWLTPLSLKKLLYR